jgi:flavin reductase (DIM6/NTAB) family NADH-FMN oxidoreductase RutF
MAMPTCGPIPALRPKSTASMFYDTLENRHGLKHDPFKALIVPRPIGWISTRDANGVANLAPYSYFNAVGDRPHYVMFGSSGVKDSLKNIEATGEFTCNLVSYELRDAMNLTSAPVPHGIDEFGVAGLTAAPGKMVKSPRVAQSPVAFECRHHQTIPLPGAGRYAANAHLVIGLVVGIHIDDRYVKDGVVDVGAMKPVARLGYMDYAVVTPETMFAINRPEVAADGTVKGPAATWDGVYR